MKPTIKQAPSGRKASRIRWSLLMKARRKLQKGGDNFVWVGFVRKTGKA
jgi:hypothetical protein